MDNKKELHTGDVVKLEGDNLECLMSLLEISKEREFAFLLASGHAQKANDKIFEYIRELYPELGLYELLIDNGNGSIRIISKKIT